MTNQQVEQSANIANENNRLMIGDEPESDKQSADENYDDEEMPDDTNYQRKVQLLHENRQKNSQHLWGASRLANQQANHENNHSSSMAAQNNTTHTMQQPIVSQSRNQENETTMKHIEVAQNDNSSDDSDTSEEEEPLDDLPPNQIHS